MREWFSASDLAEAQLPALPKRRQDIYRKAQREGWRSRTVEPEGGGRPTAQFHVSALPPEARQELARRAAEEVRAEADPAAVAAAQMARSLEDETRRERIERGLAEAAHVDEAGRRRMEARLYLLDAFDAFERRSDLSVGKARIAFCHLYNTGELDVPDRVRAEVESLSWRTLMRWAEARQNEGPAALAGRYGARSGRPPARAIEIDNALGRFVLSKLAEAGDGVTASTLREMAAALHRAGRLPEPPSARTFQRFLNTLKTEHQALYLEVVDPSAAKNRVRPAFGSASEDVVRINQRWELDSTLADVTVDVPDPATGETRQVRYHLLACIDVYTRRVRFLVSKTSRAVAVAGLLRRCLLDWGVPEEVVVDNGKEYVSNHVELVLRELDVKVVPCKPFSPWEKPHVERVIQTFQHGWFTLLPGYVGHNVAERQRLRARRENTAAGEAPFQLGEVGLSPERFQRFCDDWATAKYAHERHGSLGCSPHQKACEPGHVVRTITHERALDWLLAEPAGSRRGLFVVQREGIQYKPAAHLAGTFHYVAPELAGDDLIGREVRCKVDPTDAGRLLVLNPDTGAFLCWAVCPQLAGVSQAELASAAKKRYEAAKRERMAQVRAAMEEFSAAEVLHTAMEQRLEDAGKLRRMPQQAIEHVTPGLLAGAAAAEALDRLQNPEAAEAPPGADEAHDRLATRTREAEAARAAAEQAEAEAGLAVLHRLAARPLFDDEGERYEWLLEQRERGRALTEGELAFIERFENPLGGRLGAGAS